MCSVCTFFQYWVTYWSVLGIYLHALHIDRVGVLIYSTSNGRRHGSVLRHQVRVQSGREFISDPPLLHSRCFRPGPASCDSRRGLLGMRAPHSESNGLVCYFTNWVWSVRSGCQAGTAGITWGVLVTGALASSFPLRSIQAGAGWRKSLWPESIIVSSSLSMHFCYVGGALELSPPPPQLENLVTP
jgi:hypothetical protein